MFLHSQFAAKFKDRQYFRLYGVQQNNLSFLHKIAIYTKPLFSGHTICKPFMISIKAPVDILPVYPSIYVVTYLLKRHVTMYYVYTIRYLDLLDTSR